MPLRSPNLDDRTFQDLVEQARSHLRLHCPSWTDQSPSDPGMVLLEAFAHLTEVMLYRLNRIPEKAYIEFLNLLGLKLEPPAAATVDLVLTRARPGDTPLAIPELTRVTTSRPASEGVAPVFTTAHAAVIPAGAQSVEVRAYHAEYIQERLGTGTGRPRLSLHTSRRPILPPAGGDLRLVVAVEAKPEEVDARVRTIEFNGKPFRVWTEVENFTSVPPGELPYVVDRLTGVITFAPALRMRASSIKAIVTDGAGSPVAGANVAIRESSSGTVTARATDAAGTCLFESVQPGGYSVNAEFAGLPPAAQENLQLQAGVDVIVNFVLRAEGAAATVVFSARHRGPLDEVERPLAPVPAEKREIYSSYWTGGGPGGNLAAGTLTVLKDPIQGVTVNNPKPAIGGRSAETLENAMIRGPLEFNSLHRCVTARDFELLAERSSGAVEMAKAITKSEVWKHAATGTVELLLVPRVSEPVPPGQPVTAAILKKYQEDFALQEIRAVVEPRRPLGTTCQVSWAHYKTVIVRAKVVVFREEDPVAARGRLLERLYRQINPTSWRFGEPLRSSHIYQMLLREPGINYVGRVSLLLEDTPSNDVVCLTRDFFQPGTWYAGRRESLFRSSNNGEGWEAGGRFENQEVRVVVAHPQVPGWVAIAVRFPDGRYQLQYSSDCGESWHPGSVTAFEIHAMSWMLREQRPVLLMATSVGLYEYTPGPDAVPVQVEVDPAVPGLGFWAVVVITDVRGQVSVAVAAQNNGGVYLSNDLGKRGTFGKAGLAGEDVRVLAVHHLGPNSYLWAAFASTGEDFGKACARVELIGPQLSPEGWVYFSEGWQGRSCWSLAFRGLKVFAGSQRSGVVMLDTSRPNPKWVEPDKRCGLPLDGTPARLFLRVSAVCVDPETGIILCVGAAGVYVSWDEGLTYELCSGNELKDKVTLPPTWLLCSGEHQIEVVREDDSN
jgi:hypothetical protein